MDLSLSDAPHLRNMIAILLGLCAGAMTVGMLEGVSHQLYPAFSELDYDDPDQMRTIFNQAPVTALLSILLAWSASVCLGCFVAGLFGVEQGRICSTVVGIVAATLVAFMLSTLPAPKWFTFAGIAILLPSGFLGWWCSRRVLLKLGNKLSD
ncbi:MAG: hypothetical protein KDA78_15225 [Planctomycetaceae bacterium]|nr:hypothetical protein [Planctomycetaceae bacterium]